MVPLLVVAAASLESGSCEDCVGGKRVKRKVLSMRMIWLKLGLMLGSSTQHDCMMKARSGDISSGRAGLSCCNSYEKHHGQRKSKALPDAAQRRKGNDAQ